MKESNKNKVKITVLDVLFTAVMISLATINYTPIIFEIVNYLILLFFIVSLMSAIIHKKKINLSIIFMYAILLLSFMFSTLLSIDFSRSWQGMLTMIQMGMFVIGLACYFTSIEVIKKAINIFIIAGAAMLLYVVVQEDFFSGDRIGSAIGDVNTVGIYAGCLAIFILYKLFDKFSFVYLFLLLGGLLLIMLTGSRTALLSFFVVAGLYFMLIGIFKKRLKSYVVLITVFALLFIVLIYSVDVLYELIAERLQASILQLFGDGSTVSDGSTRSRLEYFILGIRIFLMYPIFGSGIKTFGLFAMEYTTAARDTFSHNNFSELLGTAGIVSFISYYAFHTIAFKKSWQIIKQGNKESTRIAILVIALIIMFLICDIGLVLYYQKIQWVLIVFCLSASNLAFSNQTAKHSIKLRDNVLITSEAA